MHPKRVEMLDRMKVLERGFLDFSDEVAERMVGGQAPFDVLARLSEAPRKELALYYAHIMEIPDENFDIELPSFKRGA